jgi:hypothetical protein
VILDDASRIVDLPRVVLRESFAFEPPSVEVLLANKGQL